MYSIRFTTVLIIFFIIGFWILFYSYRVSISDREVDSSIVNIQRADSISKFTNVNYYLADKNHPSVYLNAESLESNTTQKRTSFSIPNGKVYNDKGEAVYYKAITGLLDQKENFFSFDGDVRMDYGQSHFTSDSAKYLFDQERFSAMGNVKTQSKNEKNGDKMFINSDQAYCWPQKKISIYEGNVQGEIKRKKVYEPSVFFWTDKLKADMESSLATLSGNVKLKKQRFTAQAISGEIFLENYNKKLKYYALYDDVRLEEKMLKEGEEVTRKAFGEKLEVFNLEKRSVLTGAPKVYQGSDVVRGNVITLREGTDIIEVDDSSSVISIKGDR